MVLFMHSSAFIATRLALAPLLISMYKCIPHFKACILIGKGLLNAKLPQSRLRFGALAARIRLDDKFSCLLRPRYSRSYS